MSAVVCVRLRLNIIFFVPFVFFVVKKIRDFPCNSVVKIQSASVRGKIILPAGSLKPPEIFNKKK